MRMFLAGAVLAAGTLGGLADPAVAQPGQPLAPVDGDGIRLYVAAPDATTVDLEVMVDGEHFCFLQGEVSSSVHADYWTTGMFMADQACVLPFFLAEPKGVRLQAVGEVGLPSGAAVPVVLDEAYSLRDVYDFGLMILEDGFVGWELAVACPWLYADQGNGYRRLVEIVRNFTGEAAEATQVDAIADLVPIDGVLRLRLQEDKFEQAHIDHLAVVIGDTAILSPVAELAAIDGRHLVLERGDAVDLPIPVPEGITGPVDVTVVSHGYYIPYLELSER